MKTEKKRILSGMRPTGRMHLGHVVGVLDNWLKLQNEGADCFFEVADLHAMTDRTDYSKMQENTLEMVIDWLSIGIDPSKSTIFLQSLVPEHCELNSLFSMITPVSWLERCPVYKDVVLNEKIKNPSYGLLGYPVLQAADIALYKATHIPVGEDQAPHLEITREIIRRFNSLFGYVFPEPQTILTENPKVLGTDGRKMSKSLGNYISPSENKKDLLKKITSMVTDPRKIRKGDIGHPEICSVYTLQNYYNPGKEKIKDECGSGQRGCIYCKGELTDLVYDYFSAFREKKEHYSSRKEEIKEILYGGIKKARKVAAQTLSEAKGAMRINF